MTSNSVMIEGPNCYEELGGCLPNRQTIVVSRNKKDEDFPDAIRVSTFEEALIKANESTLYKDSPVWVAGGEYIYNVGETDVFIHTYKHTYIHNTYIHTYK